MFIPGINQTLLQAIKNKEFEDFAETFQGQSSTVTLHTNDHKDKIVNGNVIYTVNPATVEINNILFNQGILEESGDSHTFDSSTLFNRVSKQILTIEEPQSLTAALNTINVFVEKAGNNFYGAILKSVDDTTLMNPFHPLTAPLLLANFEEYNQHKYKAILYFYDDRTAADTENRTDLADTALVEQAVDQLIRTVTSVTDIIEEVTDVEVAKHMLNDTISINSKRKRNIHTMTANHTVAGASNILVAHQMLTKGVMVPYYGTSYLEFKLNESCRGAHISPFRSVNISSGSASRTTRLQFNSVCTGTLNNRTIRGLRTLMHANLSSPYTTYTILAGALAYADLCISKSRTMYHAAGILTTCAVPEVVKPISLVDKFTTPEFVTLFQTNRTEYMNQVNKEASIMIIAEILHKLEGLINEQTQQVQAPQTERQSTSTGHRVRTRRPTSE